MRLRHSSTCLGYTKRTTKPKVLFQGLLVNKNKNHLVWTVTENPSHNVWLGQLEEYRF